MKYKDFKKGLKVIDRWFPRMEVGEVLEILKTRVKIKFLKDSKGTLLNKEDQIHTYVKSHYQFLDII